MSHDLRGEVAETFGGAPCSQRRRTCSTNSTSSMAPHCAPAIGKLPVCTYPLVPRIKRSPRRWRVGHGSREIVTTDDA
jgi:hypothetical protein